MAPVTIAEDDGLHYVVFFSGGAASWAAARRLADRGKRMTLLFTDTMVEDEDIYRFIDEAARDIGAPLIKLAEGRTIWQVFKDERYLGNTRADPCSKILKRNLSRQWVEANCNIEKTVLVLGLDWTELHRLERSRSAWSPWRVEAPMTEAPYRLKSEMLADISARGMEPPRLYLMGFEHNNCGGGCVKAGQGQFINLLRRFPDRFHEWEVNEEDVRQHLGKDVSILRGFGGRGRQTLKMLRERVEAADKNLPVWGEDEIGGCACFEDPDE